MTASYGSGDVTIAPSRVGNVAVSNVSPVPALIPRIRFDLSWTLQHRRGLGEGPPGTDFILTDFPGELTVGPDNLFVGNLVRDASGHPIRSLSHVGTQSGSVALDLGGHRLERLEEHRAGGVLTMQMQLWPRVEMDGTTINAKVAGIQFQIPRDDWLAVVAAFTEEQIDILEIRYHLTHTSRFRPSLGALQRARDAAARRDRRVGVRLRRGAGRSKSLVAASPVDPDDRCGRRSVRGEETEQEADSRPPAPRTRQVTAPRWCGCEPSRLRGYPGPQGASRRVWKHARQACLAVAEG